MNMNRNRLTAKTIDLELCTEFEMEIIFSKRNVINVFENVNVCNLSLITT